MGAIKGPAKWSSTGRSPFTPAATCMVTLIPTPEAPRPIAASYGNMVGTKAVEAVPNEFRWNWTSLRPWTSWACL